MLCHRGQTCCRGEVGTADYGRCDVRRTWSDRLADALPRVIWHRLDYLGRDAPAEVRILKLAEDRRSARALIGMNGWNPWKDVSGTWDDLLDELADVIVTAGVAMAGITKRPGRAGFPAPPGKRADQGRAPGSGTRTANRPALGGIGN